MSRHTISTAKDFYVGSGRNLGAYNSKRGVPLTPIVFISLGQPATASANGLALSQSVGAGANAVLNGAAVTNGVGVLPVARNIVGAWTNNAILTVRGFDQYGTPLTETMAAAGTSFTGKKAFARVTSVSFSAAVTGATVGFGDVLGLPFRISGRRDIFAAYADDTADLASAAVVAADTNTATGTTGDVRGTIDFATASNGAVRFGVYMKYLDVDTDAGAYGVPQFAG